MPSYFREADETEALVDSVAASAPPSWKTAAAAYLGHKRNRILANVLQAKPFELEEARNHARALARISEIVGKTIAEVKGPNPRPEPGQTQDEFLVGFARLLTPPGWRDKIKPAFDKALAKAHLDMLDGPQEEVQANQALAQELGRFIRWIEQAEVNGKAALARLAAASVRKAS